MEHANSLFARLLFLPCLAVMVMLGCDAKTPASDAPDASGPTPAQQPAPGTPSEPPAVRSAPAAAAEPPTRVQQAPARVPQAEGSAQKGPLCLDLQAPRDEVLFGEPLSLVVSLVNCSPVEQQVDDLLSPDFGFLQVLMRPPDDKDQLYRPITKRDARGKRTRPLAPGDRLSALVPVYASADGWTLTRPGRYAFRAQYSLDVSRLESKSVYVTVAPPQSEAEARAASLMMSREVGWFLVTGRDDKGEGSRRLTAIVEQYPQSRLAPYARVGLAVADSHDRFDPATKRFKTNGCERASAQLAHAPEVRDSSLASAGTAAWIRCLRQSGQDKDVNAAISSFMRSHPAARSVAALDQTFGVTRKE